MNNKQIEEVLRGLNFHNNPLGSEEVDSEYRLFLEKINSQKTSARYYRYHFNQLLINYFSTMSISKKIIMATFVAVLLIGVVAYGPGKVSATSLASEINNASNAKEYTMDLGFFNILLNGQSVSKEQVVNELEKNNPFVVGGKTGYEGPAKAGGLDKPNYNDVITTPEDAQKMLGLTAQQLEEAKNHPYGSSFDMAIKFLKLKDGKETTYIGVDKAGEISFFMKVNN